MKLKRLLTLLLILTAVLNISWGVVGHRTIAKIADNHLSKNAKKEIKLLLGSETLPLVSTYADEIRPYEEFKYTSPWHYVNPPVGLTKQQIFTYLKETKKPNVYNAILQMQGVLKDGSKTKAEKTFALKFLVHLVGDLHQPMHVGRAEDSGGNDIAVKYRGRDTNLHGLWDSGLIDYAGLSYNEMAKIVDNAKSKEIKTWQNDPLELWIYESYEINQSLYKRAAENPNFDYTYYPDHAEIVNKRTLQAGVRLAGMLNEIFKK